jgi:hypothetical protein
MLRRLNSIRPRNVLHGHFRSAALLPGLSTYFVLPLFPLRELAQPLLLSSGRFTRHAFSEIPGPPYQGFHAFHEARDFSRLEIPRHHVLDQRAVGDLPQDINVLHKHSRLVPVPGKSDVQVFPVRHRQQRAVVFHPDHFGLTRTLRFVSGHGVTLPHATVIEAELEPRLESDLVALNGCDRLTRSILVSLPVRLDLLCQEQHLARPSFQRCPLIYGGHLIEADKLLVAPEPASDPDPIGPYFQRFC